MEAIDELLLYRRHNRKLIHNQVGDVNQKKVRINEGQIVVKYTYQNIYER